MSDTKIQFRHAKTVAEFMKADSLETIQKVWVLDLDANFELIEKREILSGEGSVSPILAFHGAMKNGSQRIIIVHNHPNGDSTPDKSDIIAAAKYKFIGDMMGINVLDSIVISSNGWVSLKATKGMELKDEDMNIMKEIIMRVLPEHGLPVEIVTNGPADHSVN